MLTIDTIHSRHPRGQGLLEVIIAIFIIVASVLGTTSVIVATIRAGRIAADRLTAMNLAREGIEIVRNIRDSNWLTSGSAWDTGIAGEVGAADTYAIPVIPPSTIIDPVADVTSINFLPNSWTDTDISCGGAVCSKVYLSQGDYVQGSYFGDDTRFYRLLKLVPLCIDTLNPDDDPLLSPTNDNTSGDDCGVIGPTFEEVGLQVTSEVRWPDNGITAHRVILEDRLYDWK